MGAVIYDWPRALWAMGPSHPERGRLPWARYCNRKERVMPAPHGPGVRCDWQWTSELYLPKVFPPFGRWLFRRAFRDFPIVLKEKPEPGRTNDPKISFVIGHRGRERLPLLLATLKSIAGQADCRFECIVVEQDNEPLIKERLPKWVRYVHTPLPQEDMAYSRSWAFNEGVNVAASKYLILHDNDMLAPEVYAKENLHLLEGGYSFTNLKRFVFYMDSRTTKEAMETGAAKRKPRIEMIIQNLEGGGSFGANKKEYWRIGGFDEGFVGWGGEDNEFWERANTRTVYPFGYFPILHLWHESQPGKRAIKGRGTETVMYAEERMKIDPVIRIKQLIERHGVFNGRSGVCCNFIKE